MKQTALQRHTPLRTNTELRRSPMKKRRGKTAKLRDFSQSVREAVWERSNRVCEFCGCREAVNIHHAKLRSQLHRSEGSGGIENALAVCIVCHQKIHGSQDLQALALWKAHRLSGVDLDSDADTLMTLP